MKYKDGEFKREYKDLDTDNIANLPLGLDVMHKLDRIEDWAKTGMEYLQDEPDVLERMEYTGSKDFFEDIPNIVQEIRDMIKA